MSSAIVGVLKVLMVGETAGLEKSFGTAGKLTGQFEGQVQGLGSAFSSLGRVLGPMVTTGAFAAGINKTIEYAGKISDLAAQTGQSTDSIQQMGHAAKMTGSSMDAFATAAFNLSARLGDGNDSVVGALNRLGLSYEQIRRLSPDEQFRTIADSLGRVTDQNERTTLAMDLFGKGAKAILPAIAQGYSQLADAASVAGQMQINALDQTGDALDSFTEGVMSVSVQLAGGFVIAVREAASAINNLFGFTRSLTQAFEDWGTILEFVGAKSQALPRVFDEARVKAEGLPEPIRAITMTTHELKEAEKKLAEQMKEKVEASKQAKKAQDDATAAHKRFTDSIKNDFYTSDYYVQFARGVREASFELEELASTVPAIAQAFVPFKASIAAVSTTFVKSFDAMKAAAQNLGTTILQAVQGGGNVGGAIGASLGQSLGTDLSKNIGGTLSKTLGKSIGGIAGTMLGPLGAMAGAWLGGKVGGWLGGLFGGDDKKKAEEAAAAMKARIAEMEALAASLKEKLAASRGEFDGLIGKARDLGYEFNQNGEFVSVNFEKMREVAQQFGVDLASLGPAFQSQQILSSSNDIINAFTLMEKGGADIGTILFGMKEEIGQIVGDSIKFGTTIPANMQPWVEELMRTDQLVDENGVAITDLSLIKFGDPVKTEFEKISTALLDVVTKLSEILAQIAAIPTNKTLTVATNYVDHGPPPGFGDGGEGNHDPGYAVGTMGRLGHWFGNFGAGFSTALHGMEAVITPEQAVPFAMEVLSGAGAGGPAVDMGPLLGEMQSMRRELRDQPRHIAHAVEEAIALRGSRR